MICKNLIIIFFIAFSYSCRAQVNVKATDPRIRYSGRIAFADSISILSWSASSVKINFKGRAINAVMQDEKGDNYYNVIVDGKVSNILHPDKGLKEYPLAEGLSGGIHTLELFKRTEWAMGKTMFYGFDIPEGTTLLAEPKTQKHKIEYFGDSITCGYADEDSTGKDRGTSEFENGYLSYAALTARHFNAEFYNTSKSGIGVTVSWFPLIMPEMYERLDATNEKSRWDFSKYTPDVVIINLFQNDSWIVQQPNNEQFKARFGNNAPTPEFMINAYRSFVKSIRGKYPKASIVCILGSMDASIEGSPWPGYVEKAVSPLNDPKIYTHTIPYKKTPGHPSVKEQQNMADDLINYMEKTVKW